MLCPYCAEDIKDEALICRHCGRDVSMLRPVLDKMRGLEERLAAAESAIRAIGGHLEKHTNADRPATTARPAATLLTMWPWAVAPIVLLLIAHWLIVVRLDLDTRVLRLVSIAIPLLFGLRRPRTVKLAAAIAGLIAIVSVLGMLTITSLTDRVPLLPGTARDWIETVEYILSIGLAYLAGGSIAWFAASRRRPSDAKKSLAREVALLLARSSAPRNESRSSLEERVRTITTYLNLLVVIMTAVATVLTGFARYFHH